MAESVPAPVPHVRAAEVDVLMTATMWHRTDSARFRADLHRAVDRYLAAVDQQRKARIR